ncbi:hypothetical protein FRC08_005568 [Ceratobasidium sp. 394]|nr:hypothetical protein FRC08_005568 [Ceratobasidium sp. 394]
MEADEEQYLRENEESSSQRFDHPGVSSDNCVQAFTAAIQLQAANWDKWLHWSNRVEEHRLNMTHVYRRGRHILRQIDYIRRHIADEPSPPRGVQPSIVAVLDVVGEIERLVFRSHFTILQMEDLFAVSEVWKPRLDRALSLCESRTSGEEVLDAAEALLDWCEVSSLSTLAHRKAWKSWREFHLKSRMPRRLPQLGFNLGNPLHVVLLREIPGQCCIK